MVSYPKDWKLETIGEIFNTITDYVAAGSFKDLSENVKYYNSPNYAQLIRTRDIKSKFKNRDFIFINKQAYDYLWRVHFDDTKIIMPNIGNCGEVYFVEIDKLPHERCALGPNAIMLFDTDNDMKFIYYALQRNDFQKDLKDIISPSGQTKFNKTDLSKINIRIPADIREQKAIAETLMTFDRHIENLERLIEKKKMIRDGAVEDLMTGKTRLDGFDDEWEEECLAKICNIYDGTHQTPKYTNNGIRFVSVEDISNLKDSRKFISINDFRRDFKIYPENKDILMTRIGDIGTPCLLKDDEKIAYYVSLALLKNIKINSEYLYQYIRSSNFKNELDKRILQHATPIKINKNDIGKCQVNYPTDIKEQQAIADILTAMDKEIADLEEEKDKYVALKAGAMDDLLTCKIRLV